jgi:hypothetical protein
MPYQPHGYWAAEHQLFANLRIKMNKKLNLLFVFSICLLLVTQTAHADFRKAIDFYIARDGEAMLKEVQDAVDKKNSDGLILFLRVMGDDAAASNHSPVTYEADSTLRQILSKPQWDKLRGLLAEVAKNSTADVQYDLRASSQFWSDFYREYLNKNRSSDTTIAADKPLTNAEYTEAKQKIIAEYIQRGSKHAKLQSDDIFVRAEAGDPLSQLQLGLKYLNSKYGDEGCNLSQDQLCKNRDGTKGYSWLKRAVKSYELSPSADIDVLAYEMCQVLRENAKGDQEMLRQAYLWAFVGINYTMHKSRACITDMLKAGELKRIDPELANVWGRAWLDREDQERLNLVYQARPLPSLIVEVRNEITSQDLPVFIAYPGLAATVFEDGRVMDMNQETILMQVPPSTVKAFMTELRSIGFWDWSFRELAFDWCNHGECEGRKTPLRAMARYGKEVKRLMLESIYLDPKSIIAQRMAKLVLLREKYFPYQTKACSFAKSEPYIQACKKPPLAVWHKILEGN